MSRAINACWLFALLAGAPAAFAQDAPEFERDILPIFEQRCFQCHREAHRDPRGKLQKPKGDLRLDGRDWILRGGKGGEVLVPGRPEDSELYQLTTLPADDPDVMPAKGDPLTGAEQDALRRWIAAGAPFGDWLGASAAVAATPTATPPREPSRVQLWRELAAGLAPLAAAAITDAAGNDARIVAVLPDGPLLAIAFPAHQSTVDDARLAALAPLAAHVVELDLARTAIDDGALTQTARMPRLVRLNLANTAVTDRGLAALGRLPELRSLNLYGTRIGDAGLAALAGLDALETVYVWQTEVTAAGIARLRSARPGLVVRGAPALPQAAAADQAPAARRR